LQKRFAAQGVIVIGISDEPADQVKSFVRQMGDQLNYRVAVDRRRTTHQAYLDAFEVRSLPHVFVVDRNGNLAWHGHPLVGLDRALAELVSGKFDLEAAKRSLHAGRLVEQYFVLVSSGGHELQAQQLGDQVVSGAAQDPELLNEFAWMILTDKRLKLRDSNLARRAAKLAYDATGGRDLAVVDTYARALFDCGQKAEAIRLQKVAIALCKDELTRARLEATLKEYQGTPGR
jgi:hypothetical protein